MFTSLRRRAPDWTNQGVRLTREYLLFAVVTSGYMLAAIKIEERGLIAVHGEASADYRRRVLILLPLRCPR